MEKFTRLQHTAIPLEIENVDTDQIIPARFLKATDRKGFGDNLFRDWRYDNNNNPISDFFLDDPTYTGPILIAGNNFGCGSSREHAAWALTDYGFKVVICSSNNLFWSKDRDVFDFQHCKSLRTRHFVYQMFIDIKDIRTIF